MGTLFIIATPIGNMSDITARAVKTLQNVHTIVCEDKRVTLKLLNHLGIRKNLLSLHEHSASRSYDKVLSLLSDDMDVAYVTDAGTPGLSDPGARLVRISRDRGFSVIPVPGPSALACFVSVAGFTETAFLFHGFFPRGKKELSSITGKLTTIDVPHIFYESPQRIGRTLKYLGTEFSEPHIVLARELTKIHEEIIEGTPSEILGRLEERFGSSPPKGEIVFSICGTVDNAGRRNTDIKIVENRIAEILKKETHVKKVSKMIQSEFFIDSREAYDLTKSIKKKLAKK